MVHLLRQTNYMYAIAEKFHNNKSLYCSVIYHIRALILDTIQKIHDFYKICISFPIGKLC